MTLYRLIANRAFVYARAESPEQGSDNYRARYSAAYKGPSTLVLCGRYYIGICKCCEACLLGVEVLWDLEGHRNCVCGLDSAGGKWCGGSGCVFLEAAVIQPV